MNTSVMITINEKRRVKNYSKINIDYYCDCLLIDDIVPNLYITFCEGKNTL